MLLALATLSVGPAFGATYQLTYIGKPLSSTGGAGVPGATNLQIVYLLPSIPEPGACTATNIVTLPESYSDGINSISSFTAAGYMLTPEFNFCMDSTGKKLAYWNFGLTAMGLDSGGYEVLYVGGTLRTNTALHAKDTIVVIHYSGTGSGEAAAKQSKWKLKILH
jgi:hypothetical protein